MKKMNGKKLAALMTCIVMTGALISGCGGSAANYGVNKDGGAMADGMMDQDYHAAEDMVEMDQSASFGAGGEAVIDRVEGPAQETGNSSLEEGEVPDAAARMITRWNLSLETEHYDKTMAALRASVKEMKGYIEEENEYKNYDNSHNNDLTIRIPQKKAEEWVTKSNDFGTIVSKSKSQENVTLQYIDLESRLKALRTEQEVLEKLLKDSKKMSDIIEVRSELKEVNYQIESYESQFRYLKNDISYDTIYITINEVKVEKEADPSLIQSIKTEFMQSIYDLGGLARSAFIFLCGDILYILLFGALAAVLIFAVKRFKKPGRVKLGRKKKTNTHDESSDR